MGEITQSGTDAATRLIESSTLGDALVIIVPVLSSALAIVIRQWLKDRTAMGEILNSRLSEGNALIEKTNALAKVTAEEQREGFDAIGNRLDALAELSLPDDRLLKYLKKVRAKGNS